MVPPCSAFHALACRFGRLPPVKLGRKSQIRSELHELVLHPSLELRERFHFRTKLVMGEGIPSLEESLREYLRSLTFPSRLGDTVPFPTAEQHHN